MVIRKNIYVTNIKKTKKKQDMQRLILFIDELFAGVKHFGICIKPWSGQLIWNVSSGLYLIYIYI